MYSVKLDFVDKFCNFPLLCEIHKAENMYFLRYNFCVLIHITGVPSCTKRRNLDFYCRGLYTIFFLPDMNVCTHHIARMLYDILPLCTHPVLSFFINFISTHKVLENTLYTRKLEIRSVLESALKRPLNISGDSWFSCNGWAPKIGSVQIETCKKFSIS